MVSLSKCEEAESLQPSADPDPAGTGCRLPASGTVFHVAFVLEQLEWREGKQGSVLVPLKAGARAGLGPLHYCGPWETKAKMLEKGGGGNPA